MSLSRIARADRIAQLDVLRGIAILFILFMNIQYMGDLSDPEYLPQRISWTGFDQAAWWVNRLLDGTQRGLLEMLFGAGVLIMARHAMTPDGPVAVADLHMRRNMWLMVFGIAHGLVLLWPGDILFSYGTAALLVFPFRLLRVRWLLAIGIAINALLLVPSAIDYAERRALVAEAEEAQAVVTAGDRPTAVQAEALAKWRRVQAEVTTADPAALAKATADVRSGWPRFIASQQKLWVIVQFTQIGIYFENIIEAFGTMLIGMALFKTGIIQGRASRRTYWALLAAGYGIGLALRVPATIAALRFDALPDFGVVGEELARLPLVIGHIAAVALTLRSTSGGRLLAPLAAPGRMPMTVYFSASIAAVILFGPPMALWGRLGFGALFTIAVAIIVVQVAVANLWLRRFETGPAEWLWKSLTYARMQPFRRTG